MIDAAGGKPRRFERTDASDSNYDVTWSPDGKIVYGRPGVLTFNILDPDTEVEVPLFPERASQWVYGTPVYSTDGLKLAVPWNRGGGNGCIWAESFPDRSERPVLTSKTYVPLPIAWSPDGQDLYAYEGNRPAILRVKEKTGQTEVFATLPGKIGSATMSKDGKTFVCEVGQTASDVWLVEHLDPVNEARTP
jgi:hypothetical protein